MLPLNNFTRSCLALAIGQAMVMPAQAATITVNTTIDVDGGGPCTLREAVVSLQAGDTTTTGCTYTGLFGVDDSINFDPGLSGQVITLTQTSAVQINSNLTINGLGQNLLTVSGNNNGSVFFVFGSQATISDLTVSGGDSSAIGLSTYSTVNLNNTTVSGNAGANAAIRSSRSSLFLTKSEVSGNSNRYGIRTFSGSASYLKLTDSSVSGNSGVGILANTSVVNLVNSTVSGNSTVTAGGGISATGGTISLINSTVTENYAATGGGGIIANIGTVLTLDNSSVTSNSTASRGGGLLANGFSSVTLTDSTVSGNSAGFDDGGGIFLYESASLDLNNSTLSDNYAADRGGAIFADDSSLGITNSTVTNNRSGVGGGIFFDSSNVVKLDNNIISGNTASTGHDLYDALLGGNVFQSRTSNLFGENSISSSESFSYFSPGTSYITATSDGSQPTPLSSIIGPLASNGGPTKTHALPTGSPAINAGNNALCPDKDQRGEFRNDGKCDIGAYELVGESCFVVKAAKGNAVVFCL